MNRRGFFVLLAAVTVAPVRAAFVVPKPTPLCGITITDRLRAKWLLSDGEWVGLAS